MRIALFTNTYAPSLNGVANVTHFYRLGLTERGHEVQIFAPAARGEDPFEDDPAVYRYPAFRCPGETDYMIALPPLFFPKMALEIAAMGFDLVHTQHPVWVGKWGQQIGRRRGVPIISTAHSQYEVYANRTFLPTEWIEPAVTTHVVRYFNACHAVTTPVEWMRHRLVDRGVISPVEIVPNPVDLTKLDSPRREETRAALGIGDDEIAVGYLGRLSPVKRVPILIDTVALLAKQRPEVRLVICGGGGIEDALRERGRRVLKDRVVFAGAIPHADVGHYHAAFDIFVTASISETQPLAYTEAMYVGTPVVALATPGAADMIVDGDNGLLVPPKESAAGLAAAVERILTEPGLADRLRRGGRRFAEERHYPHVAERLEEIYALAADRCVSGW